MTLNAFISKIRSGEFSIDTMGHDAHSYNVLKEHLLEEAESVRDFYQKQLEDPAHKGNPNHHNYCQGVLGLLDYSDLAINDLPLALGLLFQWRCHTCDESLDLYWRDENNLFLGRKERDSALEEPCSLPHGHLPTTHNIQVPTGKLLFANFFREFEDYDDEEENKAWRFLNFFAGRVRIMGHLAEQNVGYGQYGNTSVGIYISPDRKRIVVLECELERLDDYYDEPEKSSPIYKEGMKLIGDGYKHLGDISLGVWRVMFADRSILEAANHQEISDEMDYVDADVVPGTWNVTHYFDSDISDQTIIGTELVFVE